MKTIFGRPSPTLSKFIPAIVVAIVLIASEANCVPAGAPPNPHGAIGVAAEPSETTRGEPLLTTDGWTITVERLTLFAKITATLETVGSLDEPGEGLYLWNADERTELVMRAVPAGPRILRTQLQGEGIFSVTGAAPSFYTNMDVDKALEDRFRGPPSGFEDTGWSATASSPKVGAVLALHAEKAGRTVSLDVSLTGRRSSVRQPVEIRGDAITFVALDVLAERFFIVDLETEATAFQEIADADRDGDGEVTGAELRDMAVVRSGTEMSALEWLTGQATTILVPR